METINFWQVHGLFFLFFMFFFPRLTMLFATTFTGGIFFWVGFFLVPRLTVAIYASLTYWDTNPILVVITWIWAIVGELFCKGYTVTKYTQSK